MKKIVVVLMSMLAMLVAACGGSNAEAISTDNGGKIMQSENKTNSSKALVVYYSRSGNTEALARMIGNETGADMFRVTTVTPYPEVYRETTELARAERDNNARPAINGRVENMADYDVVYIGVPNWWSTMPMPMFTFLEQYDLSGKTIVPFVTHGGGGVANCVSDLKKAVPGATVLEDGFEGMLLDINNVEVNVQFIGRFNASNLLAVYGAACLLGKKTEEVLLALSTLRPVAGRFDSLR